MGSDRETIHAVHESDLDEFLAKLGVLDDFKAGKITCSNCGVPITRDNLSFIYPSDGTVKFLCSAAACAMKRSSQQVAHTAFE